jgi:hypothetical protein
MKIKSANVLLKICVVFAALCATARIHASVIELQLTEVNDNTLSLSGADASNWTVVGSGDVWTATRTGPLAGETIGRVFEDWLEPDGSGEVNQFLMGYDGTNMTFTVKSDVFEDNSSVADGTVVSLSVPNGTNLPIPYTVQFIDDGDTSTTVPDAASTAFCLALGVTPLIWLRYRRQLRSLRR